MRLNRWNQHQGVLLTVLLAVWMFVACARTHTLTHWGICTNSWIHTQNSLYWNVNPKPNWLQTGHYAAFMTYAKQDTSTFSTIRCSLCLPSGFPLRLTTLRWTAVGNNHFSDSMFFITMSHLCSQLLEAVEWWWSLIFCGIFNILIQCVLHGNREMRSFWSLQKSSLTDSQI